MRRKPGMYSTPMRLFTRIILMLFISAILWFVLYLIYADWSIVENYYRNLGM